MPNRVERNATGWFDVERELFLPLLNDIYRAGGFADSFRAMLKRLEDVEKRGA